MANRLRPISEDIPFPMGDINAPADEVSRFDPGKVTMAAPPPQPLVESAATSILLTALKALSQRTLIALGNLFVLAAAGSAFWLWLVTLPSPSIQQLVGLGLYGLLMLALVHLVLRRR
jgi:hypothetical protein